MPRAVSIVQFVYVTILCALLSAKLPSFVVAGAPDFSVSGAFIGAGVALVAFMIGSVFSALIERTEPKRSKLELKLMRGMMVCLAGATTSFTVFLCTHYEWIKFVLGIFIVSGAVCIFVGHVVSSLRKEG
jgi:hypothetical protein